MRRSFEVPLRLSFEGFEGFEAFEGFQGKDEASSSAETLIRSLDAVSVAHL